MASYKVSGLVAQGAASADDLLYLVDTEDGGSTYASKSITVGNFLNGFATESYVSTQLDALVNGAPAALDTLKELSDALGADSNFSTTITNLINANEVHVDNMATLTGVAKDDTNLGTFTGSTIGDSVGIKAALQALETSLETKGSATLLNATTSDKNDLVTLSGVTAGSGNLGSFTGSIITDDVTIKAALQELETEVARVDADISTQINAVDLSGIATNAGNITQLQTDLAAESTARGTAINVEATTRSNADDALSGRLDTLEADPTTATALNSAISTEQTARSNADSALSGRLDTLEADPTTQTLLSAEAASRVAADGALSGRLDTLEADPTTQTLLNAEATTRTTNDAVLSNRLNVLEADPTTATALSSEASTRASADTALSNRLDTLEADPTTQTLLDAETAARQAADDLKLNLTGGTMTGDIGVGNSIILRANGTANFGGNITSEAVPSHPTHLVNKLYADNLVAGVDLSGIATNAAAISALTNGAPELLNTLSELADAINDDENFATTITGQISTEATTRGNADTALSGRLDVLEADPTTATAVSTEASARASADTALSNRLDTLEADPTTATAVTSAIATETAARQAADALLLPLAGGDLTGTLNVGSGSVTTTYASNAVVGAGSVAYNPLIFFNGDLADYGVRFQKAAGDIFDPSIDFNGLTAATSVRLYVVDMSSSGYNPHLTVNGIQTEQTDYNVSARFAGGPGWVDVSSHLTFPITVTSVGTTGAGVTGKYVDIRAIEIDGQLITEGATITTPGGAATTFNTDGSASFDGLISASTAPTANAHLVNKLYADSLVAGVDLSGIATNAAAISAETTARTTADAGLSTRLDTLEADPTTQTLLTAEATSRTSGDSALSTRLDVLEADPTTATALAAEATARANAITALTNGAVAQNTAAIAAEVNTDRDAAITAAIAALTNGAVAQNAADILQEISDRQTAVAAETSARQTAVSSLQASITTTNANVSNNAQAITTEETARVAADAGKVDKASSVNVNLVGETSAASAPVDAQGADNFLFLVVDKATGAIKSIEKSFLEAEQLGTAGATFAFTPTVSVDGNGDPVSYQIFTAGSDLYDSFGIDRVGDLSSESIIIRFKDLASFSTWRTTDRTIVFTAADNDFYTWEGTFSLNSEGEVTVESDGYESAIAEDVNQALLAHDYEQAVVDETADTMFVNEYHGVDMDIHIEYSWVDIGMGATNGQALSNFVAAAGTGNTVVDIQIKPGESNNYTIPETGVVIP